MRLENTLKNLIWNFIGQLTLILTGLLLKKVLLDTIGTEKVGLNYVFNDLVGFLTIAELGLTNIVAFHLYGPLERRDEIQIAKIMRFFRKFYVVIGTTVILLGFAILPFLKVILGDTQLDYTYILIIFILFLLRDTEGYFLSYKSILPYADQKAYIVLIADAITAFIHTILSIFIILYTKNYIYVMMLEILRKVVKDLVVNYIVDRKYPFIKNKLKVPLEREEVKEIGQEVRQGFIGKASSMMIATSDNVIMTMFLGLSVTGLFSNYTLVLYTVQTMLRQLVSSAQASIGNLLLSEKSEVVYSVIKKMTFMAFFITSFCCCCLVQLTTPFVSMYFGEQYVLGSFVVLVCIFNIFLDILQKPMLHLADAGGLFQQTKRINLTSCIINIILSIIGVRILGIAGILLGTLISRLIEFFMRIQSNFKIILKTGSMNYMLSIMGYMFIFVLEIGITEVLRYPIRMLNPVSYFVVIGLISAFVPVIMSILLFRRSEEYSYMKDMFRLILKRAYRK